MDHHFSSLSVCEKGTRPTVINAFCRHVLPAKDNGSVVSENSLEEVKMSTVLSLTVPDELLENVETPGPT